MFQATCPGRVEAAPPPSAKTAPTSAADGRRPLAELLDRYSTLAQVHGWIAETVYAYPDADALAIRAWRTAEPGPALWLLAGIHGEEPAGPNAIAESVDDLARFAASGVPVVLLPLCNPNGYRNNWRYPNTAERDWRKGGYSVGDSEYLLPDVGRAEAARAAAPAGPETRALTGFALRLAHDYPPLLVLDLHEDALSTSGGYIYSQGRHADANPVAGKIIARLRSANIPIRTSGYTRFGEPIVDGMISRDELGLPVRDGSIDELFAARDLILEGRKAPGPAARTVIVVETPAYAGSRLRQRIAGQRAVIESLPELWRLNARIPD